MTLPTVRTVPGDRWSCHSCGACCRLYELGPVEPEVILGLEKAGIGALWAPAADGWHEIRRGPDGAPREFLTQRDGHCVFLGDDNRCAVHAALGETAKPGFCREYPFHVVDRGVADRGAELAVVVRPSCAGYHAATGDQAVADQVAATLALPRVLPIRRRVPANVEVTPGRTVPWTTWAPVEAELLGLAHGSTGDALQAIRACLSARVGVPTGDDPERARLAAGAVVEGLRRVMEAATRDATADPHRRAFATTAEATLGRALRRLSSPAPLAPDTDAWTVRLLQGFLLARWYLGVGGVPEGLAVFALQTWIVHAQDVPGAVTLADAGPVVTLWTKLTENAAVLAFLQRARPALLDLWVYLPRS